MLKPMAETLADIQAKIDAIRKSPPPPGDEPRRIEAIDKKATQKRAQSESIINQRYKDLLLQNMVVNHDNQEAMSRALEVVNHFYAGNTKLGATFFGSMGTGKTHLAAAIAWAIMTEGHTVIMESVNGILSRLRTTYDETANTTEFRMLNKFASASILVFDDFGKERLTAWSCSILWELINTRYENNLPLIITTNFTQEELNARMMRPIPGVDPYTLPSLLDRILEMADPWIEIGGKSWRTKKTYPRMMY